jgi:hypothetical protein
MHSMSMKCKIVVSQLGSKISHIKYIVPWPHEACREVDYYFAKHRVEEVA